MEDHKNNFETIKAKYIKLHGKCIKPFWSWRRIAPNGYIAIRDKEGKWVQEHRLIMSEIIGRKLQVNEIVHHFDGNKSNNSKDNLVFCKDNSDHAVMNEYQKRGTLYDCCGKYFHVYWTRLKTMCLESYFANNGYHQEFRKRDRVVYIKNTSKTNFKVL